MLFRRKNLAVETPRKLRKTTLRILIADDHDASILEAAEVDKDWNLHSERREDYPARISVARGKRRLKSSTHDDA
jgi:hypothetical protein